VELNRELKEISENLDGLHREWEAEAMKLEALTAA